MITKVSVYQYAAFAWYFIVEIRNEDGKIIAGMRSNEMYISRTAARAFGNEGARKLVKELKNA